MTAIKAFGDATDNKDGHPMEHAIIGYMATLPNRD
jgi:hypothetical protein